jgi:hypothetical protein
MNSVVGNLRKDLEELGEYVVRANSSSGWFAVFPKTWQTRLEAAKENGREGSNLIVYRTKSEDPRDHYAIPHSIVNDVLTVETITNSKINGIQRWNLTLKNGKLHVTHRNGAVDVSEHHGAPVILESGNKRTRRTVPKSVFDTHVARRRLEGMARETSIIHRSRNRKLREEALSRSMGVCETCRTDYSSLLAGKGRYALQVHHRQQLGLQNVPVLTSSDDLAVLCANCHAMIHADPRRAIPVEELRSQWEIHRRHH